MLVIATESGDACRHCSRVLWSLNGRVSYTAMKQCNKHSTRMKRWKMIERVMRMAMGAM